MVGAPGNKFWQRRSKHGRDKLFASAELLWEAACEYFQWCDDNPWMKNEALKGGDMAGQIIEIPTQIPYTMKGLCLYLGCNEAYFRNFKNQERKNSEDFSSVIERIEDTIYNQKFTGATVGAFNANIIARDLGLSDNSRVEHANDKESPLIDYSKLSDETLKEIIKAFNTSKD